MGGTPQFSGLFDCLTKTMSQGGFFSMYNGFGVSVVGIIAYRGPYFGLYDTLKEKNPWKKEKGIVGPFSKFCIAQFTAIVAGFISYPFDTVRRRLQMQSEKPKEEWLYTGTMDCAVKIVKDEGVGAIFKGFAANVLRTLGGALVLVGYDEIKAMMAEMIVSLFVVRAHFWTSCRGGSRGGLQRESSPVYSQAACIGRG